MTVKSVSAGSDAERVTTRRHTRECAEMASQMRLICEACLLRDVPDRVPVAKKLAGAFHARPDLPGVRRKTELQRECAKQVETTHSRGARERVQAHVLRQMR